MEGTSGLCLPLFTLILMIGITGSCAALGEGTSAVGAGPGKRSGNCESRMESAVAGRERAYRDAYATFLRWAGSSDRRTAVMEAFVGMKYMEFCGEGHVDDVSGQDRAREVGRGGPRDSSTPSADPGLEHRSATSEEPEMQTSLTRSEAAPATPLVSVPAGECRALADLYDATGGPQWTNQRGWTDRSALLTDCCRIGAYGVDCSGDGMHVTGLQLSGNNLRGPLPPSIEMLSALVIL